MTQYNSLSYEWAVKQAQDANCTIEHAADDVLQLDIDSDEAYALFNEQWNRLGTLGLLPEDPFETVVVRPSKSGNRHITMKLAHSLPVEQRILLQALLGSDRTREALSLARARAGNPHPVLLFRPNPKPVDHPPADPDLE